MNVQTPFLYKLMYPSMVCRIPTTEKKLFLTFDDGPIPVVTPKVVELLDQYNAKATFFCVGENVLKYPEIYSLLLNKKHVVGNHTHRHINGFENSCKEYEEDVIHASEYICSTLFRPPYGRLSPLQYYSLKKKYTIIMWDVLSYDYDDSITTEQCLSNVTMNSRNGSIIVFHDSVKAADKMLYVLPRVLKHFSEKGYSFESIPQTN